jgi:hypothetical protein
MKIKDEITYFIFGFLLFLKFVTAIILLMTIGRIYHILTNPLISWSVLNKLIPSLFGLIILIILFEFIYKKMKK